MKTILRSTVFLFTIFLLITCSKDNGGDNNANEQLNIDQQEQSNNQENEESTTSEDRELAIFDISEESDSEWDYWVVGKDGDNFLVNIKNDKPTEMYYTPIVGEEGYTIFFDENGLPKRSVIRDYIFLYDNFEGSTLDISVIQPNGEISIARNVDTGIDVSTFTSKDAPGWLRWTGHVLGLVSCGTGIAAAIPLFLPTAGTSVIIPALGCAATVSKILLELNPAEIETLGISAVALGTFATVVGCINFTDPAGLVSCASGIISASIGLFDIDIETLTIFEEDVFSAESALQYGYGDVQITLTWDNNADLDLHVIDPSGEEIFYQNPISNSGGILDVDDIDGEGPENIFWPSGQAPDGAYRVFVHHYVWNEPGRPNSSNYTVLINAFGSIEQYTGSLNLGEYIDILEFDQNGFKNSNIPSNVKITITKK